MKAVKVGVCLLALISLAAVIRTAGAQDEEEAKREVISVKSSVNSVGTIIVTARGQKTTVELQCTKTMSNCASLKTGDYLMLRLPKNRGVYDCMNVRVYEKDADPDNAQELGAYCVTDK